MAKIAIEFDTAAKTIDVMLDGKHMKNVVSAEFFSFDSENFGVEIRQREIDENNSMVKFISTMANEDGVTSREVPSNESTISKELSQLLFPKK